MAAADLGPAVGMALLFHRFQPGVAVVAGSELFPRLFCSGVFGLSVVARSGSPGGYSASPLMVGTSNPGDVTVDRGDRGARRGVISVAGLFDPVAGRARGFFPWLETFPGRAVSMGIPFLDGSHSQHHF